jgi:arylformamidase
MSGEITRRRLIAGAAAGVSCAAIGAASAESDGTPRKGPVVWLDLDQRELDDAYREGASAPNMQQILRRGARNSELVRERIGAPWRLSYGPGPMEALDVYLAKSKNGPIHVFIHGGAWRAGRARDYGFAAEMFVRAGANYLVPDFSSVTETGGDLAALAEQLRRAVLWIYRNAESFGGDPERIYVSGHSSGGHLAAVLLTTDWLGRFDLPPNVIKGGVCASGLYDLKPFRLSKHAGTFTFTDAIEHDLSPLRHLAKLVAPIVVVYGTEETPEFVRQSRHFAAAAQTAGKDVSLIVMDGYNHFEVMEQFANPLSLFGRAALKQMKLAPT